MKIMDRLQSVSDATNGWVAQQERPKKPAVVATIPSTGGGYATLAAALVWHMTGVDFRVSRLNCFEPAKAYRAAT
jgi:hypothetical protein